MLRQRVTRCSASPICQQLMYNKTICGTKQNKTQIGITNIVSLRETHSKTIIVKDEKYNHNIFRLNIHMLTDHAHCQRRSHIHCFISKQQAVLAKRRNLMEQITHKIWHGSELFMMDHQGILAENSVSILTFQLTHTIIIYWNQCPI